MIKFIKQMIDRYRAYRVEQQSARWIRRKSNEESSS